MIRIDIKRTPFFAELDAAKSQQYFTTKFNKFMHGIDNIYYSVFVQGDENDHPQVDKLAYILNGLREDLKATHEDSINIPGTDLMLTKRKFSIYEYCFGIPELYDVFMSDYLPNLNTPRIVVQLRSMALWLYGYDRMIDVSFRSVDHLLSKFGLIADRVSENRIDYCYHTNCIQAPAKYFSDRGLERELCTTFNTYHKVGQVFKSRKGFGSDLSLEYVSLGERKSNNLFFRIYDKTLEVVEQGYKSFFFDLWYRQGLISMYDKYCLEYAYQERNYDYVHKARLKFYLEYGSDPDRKKKIVEILHNKNCNIYDVCLLADDFMPQVTTILNVEYETRRKFYYTVGDEQLDNLPWQASDDRLSKLYKLIQNRSLFLDYLTDVTVSFRRPDLKYVAWWERLRNVKIYNIFANEDKLLRTYASKLEASKIQKQAIRKAATYSIYKGKTETGFVADISDLLSDINDNDIFKGIMEYRAKGQELMIDSYALADYRSYKEKKYKALKSRLHTDGSHESDK